MRIWNSFTARLRSLLWRRRSEVELNEELQAHLEREVEHRIRRGIPPDVARRQAQLEFGGVEVLKEECRDARGLQLLDEIAQDLRYGTRTLLRSPGFLIAAVLILALGIGATTAIFSLVYGVLLKPLPYRQMESLVALWMVPPAGSTERTETGVQPPSAERRRTGWAGGLDGGRNNPELAPADFFDIRANAKSFEMVVGADPFSYTLTGVDEPATLRAWRVSRGFFELAGVAALHGRTFLPEEYSAQGQNRVAVISHAAWQQRFGANPGLIGTQVRLSGQPHTVVGVMPGSFQLPVGGYYSDVEVWAPYPEPSGGPPSRDSAYWPVMARLAPGVTMGQAQQELQAMGATLTQQHPDTNRTRAFRAVSLRQHLEGPLRPVLYVLLGAVGLLLTIGCANVASLVLVRGAGRRRELEVRAALGAGPARVTRQLMVENLMLAAAGATLGVILAYALLPVLLALNPVTSPLFSGVAIDGAVLSFAVGLAGLTAVLFGLGPALRLAGTGTPQRLELGSRSIGEKRTARRMRSALVVAQITLSVTLLAGAGLLVRTLLNLLAIHPGFRTEQILSAQMSLFGYANTDARAREVVQALTGQLARLTGGLEAAAVSNLPLHETPVDYRGDFTIQGRPSSLTRPGQRTLNTIVTNNYFQVMGVAQRAGRLFNDFDTPSSERVVVISEGMARRYWPGEDPLGARISLGYPANGTATVVGIVEDVKHNRPDADSDPEVYMPHTQVPSRLMTFVVRTRNDAEQIAPAVRALLRQAIPGMPLGQIATIEYFREESFRPERFSTFLLAALACTALMLATMGLFAVVSYTVSTQQGEIAVRMALGAQQREVIGQVLRQGLLLAGIGILLGIAAALVATRLLSTYLFGITPADPVTYAAIATLTIVVAVVACVLPARKASLVNPITALRAD